MIKLTKSDAAESNAGDDFHILWTIRKLLELLNFDSDGLKSIAIEGLTSMDSPILKDPSSDVLLGVDLTEYYGGENFLSAKRVVISQLKYSTRKPHLAWTAANICQGKKGSSGSIVHRLGIFFSGIHNPTNRKTVLKKLSIKLVSNRPASDSLLKAVSLSQSILKTDSITYAAFKKRLPAKIAKEIDRIQSASLLKGLAFLDFMRVLDFSDCNTGSRFEQKQTLINAIRKLGSEESRKEYSQFHELVWSKMMPDAKGNSSLNLTDLLYKFGVSDLSDVFPASSSFEKQTVSIPREQIPAIIKEVISPSNKITALHGGAGIGKSTIAQQITSHLPKGSVAILFDCYGGGSYLDPEDKRHKHENAFMQLSNEMAMAIGSAFLVARQQNDDLYLKAFKKRLIEACELIQQVNSSAYLVILIDAADNSVTAASQYQQGTFIHDLLRMTLPEQCKLIVTARTERLASLNLPDEGVKEISLKPFSMEETRLFLTQAGFTVSEQEVEQFRELTYATPRVMSYVLDLEGDTLQQKIKPLKPKGKSLTDIFKLQIDLAGKRSGNKRGIVNLLTYLISLPRPVPIEYLMKVTGLDRAVIDDISSELWSGLIRQGNMFTFRDEDFETYLRKTYQAGTKEWSVIADVFLTLAISDDYASTHLGSALSHSGRKAELLDIVLNQKFLEHPIDPVKNKEVSVERTRQAMLHCTNADRLNLLKLQMIAAEAAKTNDVLEGILLNNPELASLYGNLQTNQRIYFQTGNPGWFGRAHFRSAAIFSRDKDSHSIAKEHFKKAEEWMRYRSSLDDDAIDHFPINSKDIAYGAEAVLRLWGIESCIKWLKIWSPKTVIFHAVRILLETLLETTEPGQLHKWLRGQAFRIDIQILIIALFAEHGIDSPLAINPILKTAPRLKAITDKIKTPLKGILMSFCESGLRKGKSYAMVSPLLDLIPVSQLERLPRFYDEDKEFRQIDLLFRKSVLEAMYKNKVLTPADFYPDKLKQKITSKGNRHLDWSDNEIRRFDGLYKHMIPIYEIRAQFLVQQKTTAKLTKKLYQVLDGLEKDWEFTHRHEHDLHYLYKYLSVKLLDVAVCLSDDTIIKKIRDSFLIRNRNNIALHLAVADRISHTKKFETNVLVILADAEKAILSATIAGSEKIDYYKEAAIVASRISTKAGKYYFDRMVEASSEVDIEAHHQIRSIANIAKCDSVFCEPKLAHDFARYIEYCSEVLSGWDHFPWEEGVEGIAKLNIASAFAVICRWDHRNARNSQKHVIQLLKLSLEQNYIDHATAGALLPLNPYHVRYLTELIGMILKKYDDAGTHIEKTHFVRATIRDTKLYGYIDVHKDLLELIKDKKYIDGNLIDEFSAYLHKLESIQQSTYHNVKPVDLMNAKIARPVRNNDRKNYSNRIQKINITSSEEILSLLNKLRNKTTGFVNEELAFDLLKKKVLPTQRAAFLTAFCNLPENTITYWTFEKVLEDLLQEWDGEADVKAWKQSTWPQNLKNRFSYFTNHDYFSSDSVSKLARLFEASKQDVATHILAILPEYIGNLSASVIYQLFECTAQGLDADDRLKLIDWTLTRWTKRIKPDFADGEYHSGLALVSESEAVITQFVRYHIGHPDKRIRWRIGHCLRRFVDLGNTTIVKNLLAVQGQRKCFPFQYESYPFYWMSAKLYLWISIDRICKEQPKAMTSFKDQFLTALYDNDLPHAQIKYFIKSACLSLERFQPDLFSPDEKNKLNTCLAGKKPKRKAPRPPRGSSKGSSTAFQFKFDPLDTLPYWYDSLGRLFDLSGNQIAHIAEKYIRTHWGFIGDPFQENHLRDQDYSLRSNDHGAEPTVEDLQTYYEYHSMFCVANELLETHPLIDSGDTYEDWDQWLSSWSLCWPDFWLADLRDPVPLVRKFHNSDWEKKDWQWNITLDDFHQTVGLKDTVDRSYLTIYETSCVYYYEDHESNFISSALVAPKYARSLLLAMQTSEHRYECHIPFQNQEKDVWEDEDDSNENDVFQMTGWLKHVTNRDEGLDDRDELYSNIQKDRIVIGDEFIKWSNAKISSDMRYSYVETEPDVAVTHLEVWNDIPPRSNYGSYSSSGARLRIKKKNLLQFLKATNRCLILKCEMSRHRKNDGFDYSLNRDYTLIYLFYPNGTIETIADNYQLR